MERTVQTADGRTLAVTESGDPQGLPVLVHMGTPNSRILYQPISADAAARGLRLISYDRPGYGGSTPSPGRDVASCAGDVRDICAALGIGRLAMWGISGGGPHVLACAALLPDLVAAVASLASPAPYGADGLDWFEGMGKDNADDFRLKLADAAAARAKMERDRLEFLAQTAEDAGSSFPSLLSPEYLVTSSHAGLEPGAQGWWEDSVALADPWGFGLDQISVPVLVVHGDQDQFVPFGHGQWLAAHVPGAESWLLEGDGHLTLMENRIGEVHAWLADHLKN
jgi:pimeloyl-ACP methyl ester carboxylesterase